MIVHWSAAARHDLVEIMLRIAADDSARAERFIEEITTAGEKLRDAPRGYPVVEGIRATDIRRRVYRGYRLFYRIARDQLVILRVLHGARDYHSLLDIDPNAD